MLITLYLYIKVITAYQTDLHEELTISRKIVPQELSALDILKILFQNNLSEM